MRPSDYPRHFLWAVDAACVLSAYVMAAVLWEPTRAFFLDRLEWSAWLAPAVEGAERVRPMIEQVAIVALMMPGTIITAHLLGLYRGLVKLSRTRIVAVSVVAPFIGLSTLVLALFALRSERWSRILLFLTAVGSALFMSAAHLSLRAYRRARIRHGMYASNVIAVGSDEAVRRLVDHYRANVPLTTARLTGFLSLSGDGSRQGIGGLSCLGDASALGDLLVHRPVHEIIAVLPSASGSAWIKQVAHTCDYFQVTLRVVPEALLDEEWKDLDLAVRAEPSRMPEIVLRPRYIASEARFVKRLVDIVVSAVLLLLLSPLFLIIAAVIKITSPSSSVFYRWNVVGYKGQPFTGFKFTTMLADADERKASLMHLNEMSGPVFKIKDDPRITPVGRWLRKYSLNELPQLWSVLKGDMSLVGPRPAGPHELAKYEQWHKRKLSVRPGVTCLWQVRGRNKISSFDDWVRMDLEYIDSWSLWLDLKILVRTAWVVVKGTGS